MVTQSWLYDLIIYIYALSLLFYFSDFIGRNLKAKRVGTGLLSFVWLLQTCYLVFNIIQHRSSTAFTMFETLLFFFLVTRDLIPAGGEVLSDRAVCFFCQCVRVRRAGAEFFFGNPNVVPTYSRWAINDELMLIHISLAMGSYAAYTAAAVFSGMYLFLHRQLKEKMWSSTMRRLPSLETTDRYTYYLVVAGTPLLLTSLALGIVWISLEHNMKLLFDPKVVNSVFVLGAYGFYLFQRTAMGITGKKKLALWNLLAFGIVVLNFVVSNYYSNFHGWTG